ncbi:PAS domain-containing sensor histidine kinase [Ponticaulis sp.]|uniref:sensor histidine kinase n=1 Tax=Ponticaulis sp. TaxID=2020902 RepID=UPI00262A33A2|nr:PAS domain-containing sensor histidine kinase [Ponticaulis sp.]MDF1678990.1 PAS domain-containing sensor histidine kinase [Ponticaulis sp.]
MPDLLTFSDRIYVDPVMLGIFLMGLAIVTVMVMTFRHNLRQAGNGVGDFPAILTILLGQVIFSHTLLFTLALYPHEQIRLTEVEIGVLMLGSICAAAVSVWLAGGRSAQRLRPYTGYCTSSMVIALAVMSPMLAHAELPASVDWVAIGVAILAVVGINGTLHRTLLSGENKALALFSLGVMTASVVTAQYVIAQSLHFEASELSRLNHDGKNAFWLEVFLLMIGVLGIGLSAVMGNNPRQHWRRFAVTAVLVSMTSIAVFTANEMSLRYSNTHFELARLVESLNGNRSALYVKYLQYEEREDGTMRQSVPSDVFRNLETYYEAAGRIDRLMGSSNVQDGIETFYREDIHHDGHDHDAVTLADEIDRFYQFMKSEFGLQVSPVEISDVDQIMFERRLNEFSNLIIASARGASESQELIRDMALLGGFFLVLFLALGVFLPAHRSTIQALDALEAEKARIYKLALCAEHTTKGIVLTNGRGQITWCNDAFCDMTGYRFSELEGYTLLQKTRNPDADQRVISKAFISLRNAEPTDIEVLALRKDGSDFWMSGSITPVVENGRLSKVVHVLNDVTEEREMRDRLATAQAEAERLALVVRHASDGIALLDAEMQLDWMNPSLEKMTGYTFEEIQESSLHELLRGIETNAEDVADMLSTVRLREPFSGEFLAYRKDGSEYWIEAILSPFFDEGGVFTGYIVVHRDISERKTLELALISNRDELAARVEERTQTIMNQSLELEKALASERELNRMQTEFVSMASHEFRTPLTIIDGIARRLDKRADKFTPDDVREKAQTLRATVKRMTMLVERTLDASRLSSGRIKLTPETFKLRDLVNEVCARQREVASAHKIDLDVNDYPEELFGDARLMDNVFTNVISNAVKYSGENKHVSVLGTTEGNYAVLRVRDSGIGIPKDELPKIFQRFFRASTSTGIPGTGIGLNLVKSLVDMHHGKVELDSVEGEWTEFTIRLPLQSPLETGVMMSELDEEDGELGGAVVEAATGTGG